MMADDQAELEVLAKAIAGMGLLGQHWLVGRMQKLNDNLGSLIAADQLASGIPADAQALEQTSVVVIDPTEQDQSEALIKVLQSVSSRPLLIVLSDSEELPEHLSDSLLALGYLLPPVRIAETDSWRIDHASYDHKKHYDVAAYWQSRYAAGRNSGAGSYGRLARFKARFLNRFVEQHGISTVIELGCGDGAQLGLARYPEYHGLDISSVVIERCQQLYQGDSSKRFTSYSVDDFDPEQFKAELSLSLDVIYHLANDEIYQRYLEHLFAVATRFVIIYSNSDQTEVSGINQSASYMRFRDMLTDIKRWHPDWSLISATANRFPFSSIDPNNTSISDFYVFEKRATKADQAIPGTEAVIDRLVLHKILHALGVADENRQAQGSKLNNSRRRMERLVRQIDELTSASLANNNATSENLQELTARLTAESKSTASGFERIENLLEELGQVEFITHGFERIEKVLADMNQGEVLASLTRSNELLLEQFGDLDRQAREAQDAHKQSKAECARLEHDLQRERQQIGELNRQLENTESRLTHLNEHEIPRLRRSLELTQYAAERTTSDQKNSLTWQVSVCIRQSVSSWRGILRLPFALWRLWSEAHNNPAMRRQVGPDLKLLTDQPVETWVELHDSPLWVELTLHNQAELAVVGTVRHEEAITEAGRWGLVRIEYLDGQRRVLAGPFRGVGFSRKVGHYKYLQAAGEGRVNLLHLRPPGQARTVRLSFQTWHYPHRVEILNQLKLQPVESPPQKVPAHQWSPPSEAAQQLGILGWPAPPDDERPLVLAVMDEFTEGCFDADLRLLQPRPDNWYALAKHYPPLMLLVESAWQGNGGSWQYRVGSYSIKPGKELHDMMAWAKESGIPSIFWNKEDPVHHEKFIEAAGLAEHVFTTDENMVESYRRRIGKTSVHALPFAAQPALHKPAPLKGRMARSCFAGSWYGDRHVERGRAMKWLLPVALKHGLDIFDRNHGKETFQFPEKYHKSIRGGLPYRELCAEYARYRLFLNVNSVTDSPTMFSRRVFELMACGTPVVSTYAKGLEELFYSDAVWLVNNEAEADHAIQVLLNDDEEWRRRSLAGIREVFAHHTYAHRINQIFEVVGAGQGIETRPQVLLLSQATSPAELQKLLDFASSQVYQQFTLLIETDLTLPGKQGTDKVLLVRPGDLDSQLEYNRAVAAAIGWLDVRNDYGKHYLLDLLNAMKYQPDASGWAKSRDTDKFQFGKTTSFTACLWRPDVFMTSYWDFEQGSIADDDLFVADAEDFVEGAVVESNGGIR